MEDPIKNLTKKQLDKIKKAVGCEDIWIHQNEKYITLPDGNVISKPVSGHNVSCGFKLSDTTTVFSSKDHKYHTASYEQDGVNCSKRVGIPSTSIAKSIKSVFGILGHDAY